MCINPVWKNWRLLLKPNRLKIVSQTKTRWKSSLVLVTFCWTARLGSVLEAMLPTCQHRKAALIWKIKLDLNSLFVSRLRNGDCPPFLRTASFWIAFEILICWWAKTSSRILERFRDNFISKKNAKLSSGFWNWMDWMPALNPNFEMLSCRLDTRCLLNFGGQCVSRSGSFEMSK